MGNKIGKRRQVVDNKYTRPQGLYQHRDIDHKKLRNLILDSKLAPCYPGEDDGCSTELEECPICFLFYPSLNRSKCCTKGLCTECFLQMKPTCINRPSQCPFCKTSNYAVEYRGAKTKEEKGAEQAEEQRVIEAQIRMRQQESHDEKERMRDKDGASSSSIVMSSAELEYPDVSSASHSASCFRCSTQDDEVVSSEGLCSGSLHARPSHSRQNRDDNCDIELEDVMVMEAIWLSIKDQGQRTPHNSCSNLLNFNWNATAQMNAFPSCGLAHAVAAFAEHQQLSGSDSCVTDSSILPCATSFPPVEERTVVHSPAANSIEELPENMRLHEQSELIVIDHKSNETEAGTCHPSFNNIIDAEPAAGPAQEGYSVAAGQFDGQRMLTMAALLAEATDTERIYSQGATWLQQLP